MNYPIPPLLFSVMLALTALSVEAAFSDISRIYRETPGLNGFDVCSGGGCAVVERVSLTQEEWQKVVNIFIPTESTLTNAQAAELERRRISKAVGVLETIVGVKTSTSTDRAGTFNNSKFSGQLDCNDEAINTTTYMRLMRKLDLIKLHEIEDMRTRNFFFNGWPHSTAVIRAIKSGDRYAVDSWFYNNGAPATIVPFALWESGFIPPDSPVKK